LFFGFVFVSRAIHKPKLFPFATIEANQARRVLDQVLHFGEDNLTVRRALVHTHGLVNGDGLLEVLCQAPANANCERTHQCRSSAACFCVRRLASCLTSSITGSLPYAPVPTRSRWHFQGMSSSTDRGVRPNSSRNFLEGVALRFADLPAFNYYIMVVGGAVDLEGAKGKIGEAHKRTPWRWLQALFEVMTENADQRCSTFLLLQCLAFPSP
jgi:hypothetical protein